MPENNIEIVRQAYDVAFGQRNMEGVLERFAPDFTWHQRPEWPGRPSYRASEMQRLWADLDGTYSELDFVPLEYVDAGDYVVVALETSARLRESAARIEARIWHVWHMRDGLALEGWAYASEQEAAETAGLRQPS